jgi:copper(I)-binding protein
LKNTGKTDDTLLSVTTDVTKTAQIHETKIDTKGVMSMNHLTQGLTIPAGKTVELKPRGLHLMLLGLTKVLKEKDTVSVALTFAKAGTKTIILPIQDIHIEQCPKDCQHCKEHKDCKDCKHCKDKAVTPQQCPHDCKDCKEHKDCKDCKHCKDKAVTPQQCKH